MSAPTEHVVLDAQQRHRIRPAEMRPMHSSDLGRATVVVFDKDLHLVASGRQRLTAEEVVVFRGAPGCDASRFTPKPHGSSSEHGGVEGDRKANGE